MRNKQAMAIPDSLALPVARDAPPLGHTLSAWAMRIPSPEGAPPGEGAAVAHGDEAEGRGNTPRTPAQRLQAHLALYHPRIWKSANTTGLKKAPPEQQGPTSTLEGRSYLWSRDE